MIPAPFEYEVAESAEHAIELPDEVDQEAHERQDHQGHSEPAAEHEVPVLRGRVVLQKAPMFGEAQQTHGDNMNGGGTEEDVEERPDEEQAAHRQGP